MNQARWFTWAAACVICCGAAACSLLFTDAGRGDAAAVDSDFQAALDAFNRAADDTHDALVVAAQSALALNDAVQASDWERAIPLFDDVAASVELFTSAARQLEDAELAIQARQGQSGAVQQPLIGLVGAGVVIGALIAFGNTLAGLSDQMNDARDRRDDALDGVSNNEDGALGDLEEAEQDMRSTGAAAAAEITTKIASDLALSPLNPTSVAGILIKNSAGNALQDGLNVLSATSACADGFQTTGCRLGLDRTHDGGQASVPAGEDVTVIVAGGGDARFVSTGVSAPEGSTTVVAGEAIPTSEASPEDVAANDRGEYTDDGTLDGDVGVGPADVGPGPADVGGGPADVGVVPEDTGSRADAEDGDDSEDGALTLPSSGTFPAEPFNGLSIEWSMTGGVLTQDLGGGGGDPTSVSQSFIGRATGAEVVIEGTAYSNNEHVLFDEDLDRYVEASLLVELETMLQDEETGAPISIVIDEEIEDATPEGSGPWVRPFRLVVPVASDELVRWSIAMALFGRDNQVRAVAVSATLVP